MEDVLISTPEFYRLLTERGGGDGRWAGYEIINTDPVRVKLDDGGEEFIICDEPVREK